MIRFIFVLVPGLDFVISEMGWTISLKFTFDLFGTLWASLTIFCLLLMLVSSVDLSKGGNSRICIYAWDEHFQCFSALANARRRDGGGMINSFAVIEIWRSGFVIPAYSVIVSCRVSSAKIVHSMYIALYTGVKLAPWHTPEQKPTHSDQDTRGWGERPLYRLPLSTETG